MRTHSNARYEEHVEIERDDPYISLHVYLYHCTIYGIHADILS